MELGEIQRNLERLQVTDANVLEALRKVPRAEFIPRASRSLSELDRPLPIESEQTISQPSLVGYMTMQLHLSREMKVLEVGTGSGYQTAILAEICKHVYTIEIRKTLSTSAQQKLRTLGYLNIHFKVGDGAWGWIEEAPFDAIIVTAVSYEWPAELVRQLKVGARLVVPIREEGDEQGLYVVTKTSPDHFMKERLMSVRFVPLVSGDL